jgi:hypothetical protein
MGAVMRMQFGSFFCVFADRGRFRLGAVDLSDAAIDAHDEVGVVLERRSALSDMISSCGVAFGVFSCSWPVLSSVPNVSIA